MTNHEKKSYEVGYQFGKQAAVIYKDNPYVEIGYDEYLTETEDPSDFIRGYQEGFKAAREDKEA